MTRKADHKNEDLLEVANAQAIADMLSDPDTPPGLRVKMLNRLLEAQKGDTFFASIFHIF